MSGPRDYTAAATELGVGEKWLRENTPRVPLPHHKFSVDKTGQPTTKGRGEVVFYDEDIDAIKEMFAQGVSKRPTSAPLTRRRAS